MISSLRNTSTELSWSLWDRTEADEKYFEIFQLRTKYIVRAVQLLIFTFLSIQFKYCNEWFSKDGSMITSPC